MTEDARKRIGPVLDDAVDRLGPAVGSARDKVSSDLLPTVERGVGRRHAPPVGGIEEVAKDGPGG